MVVWCGVVVWCGGVVVWCGVVVCADKFFFRNFTKFFFRNFTKFFFRNFAKFFFRNFTNFFLRKIPKFYPRGGVPGGGPGGGPGGVKKRFFLHTVCARGVEIYPKKCTNFAVFCVFCTFLEIDFQFATLFCKKNAKKRVFFGFLAPNRFRACFFLNIGGILTCQSVFFVQNPVR